VDRLASTDQLCPNAAALARALGQAISLPVTAAWKGFG
jgi:hypothetical protein